MVSEEVLNGLKQRPPFLFIDEIIERGERHIHARKLLSGEEDFFKGHFPGNPIMPGVLLQEAAFQAGSLILAGEIKGEKTGVVSRVKDVKYRSLVKPGDILDIKVELKDILQEAYFFDAKIYVQEKRICQLSFTCNLI